MKSTFVVSVACLVFALSINNAWAQGDTCSTATPISGNFTMAFNTSSLSTSGFSGGGSCGGGANSINRDAFFQWTANVAGDFRVDTFGSAFDTRLSVHTGSGCAATCLQHNDDSNGLQSAVSLNGVSAGDTFLIQAGGFGNNSGNTMLNIGMFVDLCSGGLEDSFEPNDYCNVAYPLGDGTYVDLFTSKIHTDNFAVCVAAGETLQASISFMHSTADLDLYLWNPAFVNCGVGSLSGGTMAASAGSSNTETLSWTNTSLEDISLILQVDAYVAGGGACNLYDLTLSGADACGGPRIGAPICSPMNSNSTGFPTELAGAWGSGTGSGLHLEVTSGPPNQYGCILIGTGFQDPGLSVSQGRLCLSAVGGNSFARYMVIGTDRNSVGRFDSSGVLQNLVSTSAMGSGFDVPMGVPMPGSPMLMPGQTWYFQSWHREAGGQSNFSNALPVRF